MTFAPPIRGWIGHPPTLGAAHWYHAAGERLLGHAIDGDDNGRFNPCVLNVGTVTLERGKESKAVVIKPTRIDNGKSLMNVRQVELSPAEQVEITGLVCVPFSLFSH